MDSAKLLRIKVQRLTTGRALVREIFLRMPANRRFLRLARPGDEVRESLLARLLGKPDAELYVIPRADLTEDPETCVLFEEDAAPEATPTRAAQAEPEASAPPEVPKEGPALAGLGESLEEASTRLKALAEGEDSDNIKALGEILEESSQRVRALDEQDESARVKAGEILGETARKLAETAEEENLSLVKNLTEALDQAAQGFSQESETAAVAAVGNDADAAEAAQRSVPVVSEPTATGKSTPAVKAVDSAVNAIAAAVAEDLGGAQTLGRSVAEIARRISESARKEESESVRGEADVIQVILEQIRQSADKGDENTAQLLGEALRDAAASFLALSQAEGTDEIQALAAELHGAVQTFDSSAPPVLADALPQTPPTTPAEALSVEEAKILDDSRAMLTMMKASEEMAREAKKVTNDQAHPEVQAQKINELQEVIDEVGATGTATSEQQARFAVDQALDEIAGAVKAGQGEEAIAELYRKAEEARKAASNVAVGAGDPNLPQVITQGAELPGVVARLAASLAVALGYTNLEVLYEVSLGAILYFAKKDGEQVTEDSLPRLTRSLLGANETRPDFVTSDSAEILAFLDAYLQNPTCDRTQLDLSKRTLTHTLAAYPKDAMGPDVWAAARWTSFATLGPTIEIQSICSKASAMALRDSRSFVA